VAPRSEDPKLIIHVISFKLTHRGAHGTATLETDRRTDRRTTYDSNTALALRASRGKNNCVKTNNDRHKLCQQRQIFGRDSSFWHYNVRMFARVLQKEELEDVKGQRGSANLRCSVEHFFLAISRISRYFIILTLSDVSPWPWP